MFNKIKKLIGGKQMQEKKTATCPRCNYTWEKRKPQPKQCPKCQRRLDK